MKIVLLLVGAILCVFLFPWPLSGVAAFLVALIVPAAGLMVGLITDALYYTPGVGYPVATIAGLLGSVIALFVRRFIKTRIIEG